MSLSTWPDRHVSFCQNKHRALETRTAERIHTCTNPPFSTLWFYSLSSLWWMALYFCCACGEEELVVGILPCTGWSHSCRILSDWRGTPDLCGHTTLRSVTKHTQGHLDETQHNLDFICFLNMWKTKISLCAFSFLVFILRGFALIIIPKF